VDKFTNKGPRSPNITKRRSLNLFSDTVELLDYLAEEQGVSDNEAIRRAIATEAYFLKERRNNSKILIQDANGEVREVVFR
jgi:Ribbon-helix-helix protein, copG family